MPKYFIASESGRSGPFALSDLLNYGITSDTPVWTAGMADWVRAEEVAELHELLESLPPPLPPPALIHGAADAPVKSDEDFIVLNPNLPKMARLICLYALVIYPLQFLIANAFCLSEGHATGTRASYIDIDVAGLLLGLIAGIVFFAGGLKLRAMKRSGLNWVKVAILIDLILTPLVFIWLMIGHLNSATPVENEKAGTFNTKAFVSISLWLSLMAFEATALTWMIRKQAKLRLLLT